MDDRDAVMKSSPPGMATELADEGLRLFRWRSYVPLVVLAYLLLLEAAAPSPRGWRSTVLIGAGMAAAALGLGIRGWAVGQVRPGTSGRGTRAMTAESLNTDGLYSAVRHPLYLGNFFIWMGVALCGGRLAGVLVTAMFFWICYERIMLAEERFLHAKFGGAFEAWCARTPAFLPRRGGWRSAELPFSLPFALGRDYQAVFGFVAAATSLQVARSAVLGSWRRLDRGWWVFLAVGLAYYVVMHLLKTRTRVLDGPGR